MTLFFHAEHSPLDQSKSVSSTRLAVYNSKSSKPNRLASPFGQRRRRRLSYIQKFLLKAPTQLVQWLDPPLVAVLAKILIMAKTNLLAELPPRVATIAPLLLLQHVLLLLLLHLLLLRFLLLALPTLSWLDTWKMTSSGSSGLFWILDLQHLFWPQSLPPLRTLKAYVSSPWKLDSRIFIRVKLTWSVTIFSSNAKITLLPPVPQAQTEFRLQLPSWKIPLCSNGSNTSIR